MIGVTTYAPSPDWFGTNPRTIRREVQQPEEVEAVATKRQTSAKETASRMNPAQVVRSASSMPIFPAIYRAEFGQNVEDTASTKSPDGNVIRMGKSDSADRMGGKACQTCSERRYQDGSDDPGVSFKAPTHIAPGNAAAAVSSHEQEHVVREQTKAQQENREIIAQSVQIFTAICPECGRTYVAGGKTTTTSMSAPARNQVQEPALGQKLDTYA